jgi:hypothetical protein
VKITGVSGAGLPELVGQRASTFSSSGSHLDPRADLFLEDLVALCGREGIELARQLLAGGRAVDERAYPIRTGRSAGTGTSSSSRSAVTRTKRGVWYFTAVFPPRVRQALPAGASQFGQSRRSTANAA